MRADISAITQLATIVRRDIRRWLWLRGVAGWIAVVALLTLGSLILDRLAHLDQAQRGLLLAFGVLAAGVAGWYLLIRHLLQPLTDEAILLTVEQKRPELGSKLISAYQLAASGAKSGESEVLIADSVSAGLAAARELPRHGWIESQSRNRRCVIAAVCLVPWVLVGIASPGLAGRWLRRNLLLQSVAWPRATTLTIAGVTDNQILVPRGEGGELQITAEGEVPSHVFLDIRGDGKRSRSVTLSRSPSGAFEHRLRTVAETLRVRARGGDHTTDWVQVVPIDRPQVQQVTLLVTPPAYTGVEPFALPSQSLQHTVPAGSRIGIEAQFSQPLQSWFLSRGKEVLGQGRAAKEVLHDITPEKLESGLYRLDATNEHGLALKPPYAFRLLAKPDAPPRVTLRLQGMAATILPGAKLPLVVTARDAYGIAAAALVVAVQMDGEEPVSPLSGTEQALAMPAADLAAGKAAKRLTLDTTRLKLVAGSRLYLQAKAVDNNTLNGPGQGVSRILAVEVVDESHFLRRVLEEEQTIGEMLEKRVKAQENLQDRLQELPPAKSNREVQALERALQRESKLTEALEPRVRELMQMLQHNPLKESDRKARLERLQKQLSKPLEQVVKSQMPDVQKQFRQFQQHNRQSNKPPSSANDKKAKASLRRAQQRQDDVVQTLRQMREQIRTHTTAAELVQDLRELIDETELLRQATTKEAAQ